MICWCGLTSIFAHYKSVLLFGLKIAELFLIKVLSSTASEQTFRRHCIYRYLSLMLIYSVPILKSQVLRYFPEVPVMVT